MTSRRSSSATDQRTSGTDEEGKPEVKNASTVTLEATPKIAEKIAVAQTIGQLSLSLRSIADNTQELEAAIASGEVDVPEGDDPKAERKMLLAIASKPIDTTPTFTVGGDVSRYQRSSVPAKPSADGPGAGGAAGIGEGPGVRVARGTTITFVPLGAK